MNIVKGYPPNYNKIKKKFDFGNRYVVFTYGEILFNPAGVVIPPHLHIHEQTHSKQQSIVKPEVWWDKFLEDKKFRLDQEIEAYREQYKFIKSAHNRHDRRMLLKQISQDLGSGMYGNIVKKKEAEELIKGG